MEIIRQWGASLPRGAMVLDIGAGSGLPLTAALLKEGLGVFALDASPKMVAAFRQRFPGVQMACEAAESSSFFGRAFDGAMAIGLMFLLPVASQRLVIHRVARALKPEGRFLFSAPRQACTWKDLSTGRPSRSLGAEAYRRILAEAGLQPCTELVDEGGNTYYDARKPPS